MYKTANRPPESDLYRQQDQRQPVGAESQSEDIASDMDSAIEKNNKAALRLKGLDKEHIRFDAKTASLS